MQHLTPTLFVLISTQYSDAHRASLEMWADKNQNRFSIPNSNLAELGNSSILDKFK
jgi:hypothetical protein